ncbi:MAG: VOC family protein [Candidatus Methanomethylicaceae archaeon]|jgi:catechol 2,3-dioxygenase-like lactoylglutathione lyase family enzyme
MPKKEFRAIIGHLGIEVSSLKKSRKFYETLLKALGCKIIMDENGGLGMGNKNFQVWISEGKTPRIKRLPPTGEEMVVAEHVAFFVSDKASVDKVADTMKKGGFEPLFAPAEYPEFVPGYYAVSYCDPDNYVIEIHTIPERK